MEILIHRDGQDFGPYSMDQITRYLQNGSISEDDFSWVEGREGWRPLKELLASVTPPLGSLPELDFLRPDAQTQPNPPPASSLPPIPGLTMVPSVPADPSQKADINGILLLVGIAAALIIFAAMGYGYVVDTVSKYHWPGQSRSTVVLVPTAPSVSPSLTQTATLNADTEGLNFATMDGKTTMNFYLEPGPAAAICQKILDKIKTIITDNADIRQITIHLQVKSTPPINLDFAVSDSGDHIRQQTDFLTGPSPTREQIMGVLHIAGMQ